MEEKEVQTLPSQQQQQPISADDSHVLITQQEYLEFQQFQQLKNQLISNAAQSAVHSGHNETTANSLNNRVLRSNGNRTAKEVINDNQSNMLSFPQSLSNHEKLGEGHLPMRQPSNSSNMSSDFKDLNKTLTFNTKAFLNTVTAPKSSQNNNLLIAYSGQKKNLSSSQSHTSSTNKQVQSEEVVSLPVRIGADKKTMSPLVFGSNQPQPRKLQSVVGVQPELIGGQASKTINSRESSSDLAKHYEITKQFLLNSKASSEKNNT